MGQGLELGSPGGKLPNLFHHEEGVVSACSPYALGSHGRLPGGVSRPWRYALLKVGPTWQPLSTSFQQVFACVDTAHVLAPARRQSWNQGLLVYSVFDRRGRLGWEEGWLHRVCVCLAVVVLIGLVNRIFHKRSDGPEQFLFSARKGMRLFHSLKSDLCSGSGSGGQTAFFVRQQVFVSVVFSVNAFAPRRNLILSFVFGPSVHSVWRDFSVLPFVATQNSIITVWTASPRCGSAQLKWNVLHQEWKSDLWIVLKSLV